MSQPKPTVSHPVRSRTPTRTVRFRLAALYCLLFFPLGVALIVITAVVTYFSLHPVVHTMVHGQGGKVIVTQSGGSATSSQVAHLGTLTLDLPAFLLGSGITLLAMVAISALLGWLIAGRVLRPVRTITETTRAISENDLHQRLALTGPRDELVALGDTIDDLLERLERAFESQRRFVANASHELRTPLAADRAMLQVALADPNLTLESLRAVCDAILDGGREQERLMDALLVLARSQRGLEHKESVSLESVVSDAVDAHRSAAERANLQIALSLDDSVVSGDALLLYRLVSNLVDNAIRYNNVGGQVAITLTATPSDLALTVTNTGQRVAPEQVDRLVLPFQRGTADRIGSANGLGLGLSIVAEIAQAHGAAVQIDPVADGGMTVTVRFPVSPTTPS